MSSPVAENSVFPLKPRAESYGYEDWTISAIHYHINSSKDEEKLSKAANLPRVPEMLFDSNELTFIHWKGFGISFKAIDALKLVENTSDPIKVAASEEWRESRKDCKFINDVVDPYDWTYTSKYKGTLLATDDGKTLVEGKADGRLNIQKLMRHEKILFWNEVQLFEDELGDNGASFLTVKIRVMPSGFFVLLRQYVRVDEVLIRILDTRFHFEEGNRFILREFSLRENKFEELSSLPSSVLFDADKVYEHLPVRELETVHLNFPAED